MSHAAWQLTSVASQLCQTLGWHRASTFDFNAQQWDPNDTRPVLFWLTYMFDKALSLSLGRASTIQDYDITVPREAAGVSFETDAWRELMTMWIKHAEIQGNIYERLYSPAALAQPEAVRVASAQRIVEELKSLIFQSSLVTKPTKAGIVSLSKEEFALLLKSEEVGYMASLTLAYRAIPPKGVGGHSVSTAGRFNEDCVDSARDALNTHQYVSTPTHRHALMLTVLPRSCRC